MEQTNSFNLSSFKAKEEDKSKISMTDITMIRETVRIGIDQVVEIGELHLVVALSMDKVIEVDQGMNRTTGMTSGEVIWECIKIRISDRITEVDTEKTIGMKITKEVGVGLQKGKIRVI